MRTLLLELAGPMQAWGSRSRFATRATELAPTKSGVVGLIAAARGLPRTAVLDAFAKLRFGVRVDQPGRIQRDFQTARTLDGSVSMPLSHRYYLSDAVFLAGLASSEEPDLLNEFAAALARPVFPLFLGRRAFPPAGPIRTEIVEAGLEDALASAAWRAAPHHQRATRAESVAVDLLFEATAGDIPDETWRDEPISFDPRRREYGWRDITRRSVRVENRHWTPPVPRSDGPGSEADEHDPFTLVAEEA